MTVRERTARERRMRVPRLAECPSGLPKTALPVGVTHDTHYTMAEICAKFDYSYGRLYTLRMRYQIPSIHAFGTTCYPKEAVDKAVSEERERLGRTLGEHWYTCGELMRIYGLGKTQVRRFANTHHVRTKKANGNRLYYLKRRTGKLSAERLRTRARQPRISASERHEQSGSGYVLLAKSESDCFEKTANKRVKHGK